MDFWRQTAQRPRLRVVIQLFKVTAGKGQKEVRNPNGSYINGEKQWSKELDFFICNLVFKFPVNVFVIPNESLSL